MWMPSGLRKALLLFIQLPLTLSPRKMFMSGPNTLDLYNLFLDALSNCDENVHCNSIMEALFRFINATRRYVQASRGTFRWVGPIATSPFPYLCTRLYFSFKKIIVWDKTVYLIADVTCRVMLGTSAPSSDECVWRLYRSLLNYWLVKDILWM